MTKMLGDIMCNKTLFKTTIPAVKLHPAFLEKVPKLTRFAAPERVTNEKSFHDMEPFGMKCTINHSDKIKGATVISFTTVSPLIIHFRLLQERSTSFSYPDLEGLAKDSLFLSEEELAALAIMPVDDLKRVIERLDNYDSLDIKAEDGELHIEVYSAEAKEFIRSHIIAETYRGGCNPTWPEGKVISVSVGVIRKVVELITTPRLVITPALKEGVRTFFVSEGKWSNHGAMLPVRIAAMPVCR